MRELARILLSNEGTQVVAKRLEAVMHSEIAIKKAGLVK